MTPTDPYKAEAAWLAAGSPPPPWPPTPTSPEPPPKRTPSRPTRGTPGNAAPQPWTLERALRFAAPVGKCRGATAASIARYEPDYLTWIARTPTLPRNFVLAARIVITALARGEVVL